MNACQSPSSFKVAFPLEDQGNILFYSYNRLVQDEIRLLLLHPGTEDDQLRAVVFQTPLQRASSFQAVSYTWGFTELSHLLWTPEGSVEMTLSMYSTLRSLPHETQPLLLWADAVCIIQKDIKKNVEQVRILPHISKRATCVLACLGTDENGDRALEALMQVRVNEALGTLPEEWP